MPYLTIRGKKQYVTRMEKHLKKEHPSTKHRMRIVPASSLSHAKMLSGFMKTQGHVPKIYRSTQVLRESEFNKKFPYVICVRRKRV